EFSDVDEWKRNAVKKAKEVDEDLDTFTDIGDEHDVETVLSQIESVMEQAQTSKGSARFSDFKGASNMKDLEKLQGYNEDKQVEEEKEKEAELKKAKDTKENALQNQEKPSSRDVINKAYEEYKNGDIEYEQYEAILNQVDKTSNNMNEKELEEKSTASFLEYLDNNDLLDDYLADHQPFVDYIVDDSPRMIWEHGEGYLPIFLKNAGDSEEKLADYLLKNEKEITKATNIADLDTYRDIKKKYSNSNKLAKTSKYLGRVGTALGLAGVVYGFYDDLHHNDKSVGEATAHSGALLAIGGTVALGSNPGGWAIAAGIGLTTIFEFAYSHNFLGLQDGVDSAGQKLSEWGEATGDFFKSAGEAITGG
ncbi:MAG TPA: hypothetical protein VK072_07625, partial [Candidatus Avamphibacillus sp.]|nr:hypothetical protein [Candidatus Avamphibacillus sp.]